MNATIFLATTGNGLARAQRDAQGNWTVAHLLPGRRVTCLARDPHSPNTLYAGTQDDGVIRSDDGGVSWQPADLPGITVKSIALSQQEPGVLYAGTRPALVYASRDHGTTWRELEGFRRARRWFWLSPAEPPDFRAYMMGLAVSPTDPNILVAGIEAGSVVRSTDGGQSWSRHCRKADRDCHWLSFHATNGNWAYEAGGGGPAFSRDGGESWQHPTTGLHGPYCMACAADPAEPEIWYVSASPSFSFRTFRPQAHVPGNAQAAIYRYTANGAWTRLTGGLPQPLDYMPYTLLTDPAAPGHLYAGLSNGYVWHSPDYGDSWQQLPFDLGNIFFRMIML